MADVQADFFMEPRDAKWSSNMSTTIRDVAGKSDVMREALHNIECHSQTCRVEVTDDGSGKITQEMPIFVNQLGGNLPSAQADRIDNGNGKSTLVLYLTNKANGV
jgi:hypothetical protein